jgi:prepilin-type N-terminal cleavage/methylation domain-containing protein
MRILPYALSTQRSTMTDSSRQGFTLVELSIVLVIIGLLLGGVLIGRDMIRQSQLRSVTADVEGYFAATQMFMDKYNCIPGDCSNAETYWTDAADGNGDGRLGSSAAGVAGENFGAWQQLALAGFIKGKYTGIAGDGGANNALVGVNVPASKISSGGYTWYYYGMMSGDAARYDGYYGNFLWFGTQTPSTISSGNILTPAEAYQIDLKMDDGIPGTGNVRTYHSYTNCNTGTAAAGATSTYNVASHTGIACFLMFLSGF